MSRGLNSLKVREWTGRLARFRKSQVSVARFCEAEGVSTASFYRWQRKLREGAGRSNTHAGWQGSVDRSAAEPSAFREVPVTAMGPAVPTPPVLTVCWPNGMRMQVADNVPVIRTVVRELVRPHHVASPDGLPDRHETGDDEPRGVAGRRGVSAC